MESDPDCEGCVLEMGGGRLIVRGAILLFIVCREAWGQPGSGGGYEFAITSSGKVRLDLYQSHNQYTTAIGATTLRPACGITWPVCLTAARCACI